uniref:EamA domain-containing protein n=1 Tax=Strigamia maritima TaxID=126957 RepID=T1JB45_STRMM
MGDERISTISKPYRPPTLVITSEDRTRPESRPGPTSIFKQLNGAISRSTTPSLQLPSTAATISSASSLPATSSTGVSTTLDQSSESTTTRSRISIIRKKCCSKRLRKTVVGCVVSVAVAAAWVGATHFIKRSYLYRESTDGNLSATPYLKTTSQDAIYDAPFFTTWFCTLWTGTFFPLFVLTKLFSRSAKSNLKTIYRDSVRLFREKGLTTVKVVTRVAFFCALWVTTNYMYNHALRVLDATDVIALYSSSVSFVYLLSWVILHEQFVGVRIVAVILCNTGIALLAYMDGLTRTPTLGGVILAAASSAGSAVYKVTSKKTDEEIVLFKKIIGEASFAQVALFFTLISIFNTFLLWPVLVTLYFTHVEIIRWLRVPWWDLCGAAGLSLVTNLLGNFGVAVTYELFITLGLIIAVPLSAALDSHQNRVKFEGMKLAGITLIGVGFLLILFPENWPDYVTKVLRWRRTHTPDDQSRLETSSGGNRSRLRSPTGLVR